MTVVLVNEFSDINCPVTKLVYDLGNELSTIPGTLVVQANFRTKYRPGGTRWQRVLTLLGMHITMPFVITFQWVRAKIQQKPFCVIVTTLPPLLHWNLLLLSLVLRYRCILWYQDAHPEIEARILKRRGFHRIAKFLTSMDSLILKSTDKVIVLDQAMANLLTDERSVSVAKISIAPPWTAFVSPAKSLRDPSSHEKLKLIYAGNYGFAHDLKPFAKMLSEISTDARKRLQVIGIGMNETSRRSFETLFNEVEVPVKTFPRIESFLALLKVFEDADFGLVSLRDDYAGIAAPSKAYTYISQGLPIVYAGPQQTLPSSLVHDGLGVSASDFVDALKNNKSIALSFAGQVPIDPKLKSIQTLIDAIYAK